MKNAKKTSFNESRNSLEKYFQWRIERSAPTIQKIKGFANLKGTQVLEIGCGFGALTWLLLKESARVVATETDAKSLKTAKRLIKNKKRLKLVKTTNEHLKFKNSLFDFVILFDVIEHVADPKIMMKEAIRVLKPGGILYVEFTPYYSIIGHHLYDYAKWPIHILPHKYIKKIIFKKKTKNFFTTEEVWQQFLALNKIRISEFQNLTRKLKIENERYIVKYPDLFEVNLPFLSLFGPFKDFFSFTFEGIYKK